MDHGIFSQTYIVNITLNKPKDLYKGTYIAAKSLYIGRQV